MTVETPTRPTDAILADCPSLLQQQFKALSMLPHGVKKLRELILQLAVQGKLVPQHPDDEPATELLKRIDAEKQRLIDAGDIKKPKPLPPIGDSLTPFDLPKGWAWVRLGEIAKYIQRGKSPKYTVKSTIRVVSQKCVQWAGFDLTPCRYIDEEAFKKYEEIRLLQKGDLLWNSTGTGTIGRVNINPHVIDREYPLVADSHVTVVRLLESEPEYIWCWLAGPEIYGNMEDRASGSTNQVELSNTYATQLLTPLPPLAEQERIVARVNELMALCDQLEQQHAQATTQRQAYVQSACHQVTTAPTHTKRHVVWQPLANNFTQTITTVADVKTLRNTILQLAVQGKLVPQHPDDEPATELLKRIDAEKQRLIDAGELKPQKPLPPIDDSEPPFDLPSGWAWVRLGDVGIINPRNYAEDNVIASFIPMPMISANYGEYPVYESRAWGEIKSGYTHFANRDIGLAKITPCFENSKSAVFKDLIGDIGAGTTELHIVRPYGETICPEFIWVYFKTPKFLSEGKACMTGSAGQKRVPKGYVAHSIFGLPPLAEQERIVARVNELMALCEELEDAMAQQQHHGQSLMNSLVHFLSGGGA